MNEFLQKLFTAAGAAGIEMAEAYVVQAESFEAVATNGEITQYSDNVTHGLGFRALINGKMGYASTEAMDDQAIAQLIKGVKESAHFTEDEDSQFLYEGDIVSCPDLSLFAPSLESVMPQAKLDFALALEAEAKASDPRIENVGYNTLATGQQTIRIVNTLGLDRQYKENYCGAYLQPIAREGDSVSSGMEMAFSRDFHTLHAQALAKAAVRLALDGLHAAPVPSGTYRVLFQNVAMTSLLGVFADAFSAENVQKGMSLLQGKLGTSIASEQVTLLDDPLRPDGLASRPFDGEGVPSSLCTLVENGVLMSFLHNLKTAHKDGIQSTGHASRSGYAGAVRVAPSNFYIKPGTKALADMMKAAENGLVITEVSGLHAGADAISGDFSLLAKGYAFEEGKRTKPVAQITVAGNFFDMLKSIRTVGNDLRFPQGTMGSPSIDVGELSVGGAK